MVDKFILAHDLGTSSNKAVLFDTFGKLIKSVKQPYPIFHPALGYAEENALDWWRAVCETTRCLLYETGISPSKIVGVTVCSHTQTVLPVDNLGNPLTRAMIYLDSRGADVINKRLWTFPRILGYNLIKIILFLFITGGSPGQTGKDQIAKLLWLKEHQPDLFDRVYKFLDAKDFILFKLTRQMVTSVDLAHIWWLMDTRNNRNKWHRKLCQLSGIDPSKLADIKASNDIIGTIDPDAAKATGLLEGTPVINGSGDLSASAIGSGAIGENELHTSLGVSGWVAGHVTRRKIDIPHYTGCIGSAYPQKYYLVMAHQETAGVCLEWLSNNLLNMDGELSKELQFADIYQLFDRFAKNIPPGSENLLFTPWLYGERSPLDDEYVRGGFYNIGLRHHRGHFIRAVMEGIAFNTRWALQVVEKLYKQTKWLSIIGGGAKSNLWCQIMADVTNKTIQRVVNPQQAAARGVALLASLKLGFISQFDDIKKHVKIDRCFYPNSENREMYDRMYKEFKNIYKQNKKWFKRMNKSTQ